MNLLKLREPFKPEEIEWRIQQSGIKGDKPWGMCLAYVQNRAIMDRLDDICTPSGWMNIFRKAPEGGILCGISIKCVDEWVIKWDGASNTDIEAVKGGLSNAMKRAAVQWGIGRYLYALDTGWAVFTKQGKYSAKMKDGSYHKWNPPQLPEWALPGNVESQKEPDKSFLEKMKGYATHESEAYWKVMNHWQIKQASVITDKETQEGIIKEIEKEIRL